MQNVKEYLKSRNMPYQTLADRIGYSRVHVSCVINGKKKPSVKFLKLLRSTLEEEAKEEIYRIQKNWEDIKWEI